MAAVTQLTPNFLGGVSRQTDDKKLDGQVVDIINGYPDPTYGLVKRPSTGFLYDMKRPISEKPFKEDELKDAFWFYAETKVEVTADNAADYPFRSVGDIFPQPYVCAIHEGQVYVWNSITGKPQLVFNSGLNYLKRPDGTYYSHGDFHARTILDTTIICNRNVKAEMVENTDTFTKGLVGTVRINQILPETEYVVVINDQPYRFTTPEQTSMESVLAGLEAAIPAEYNPALYKTSLELSRSTPFTLGVKDGAGNDLMNSYQDTVANKTLLATPSKPGRLVEVIGDEGGTEDNYYLEFVGGYWTETIGVTEDGKFVDKEIDAATMPHRLYLNEQGQWQFGPIDYTDRLVGDDESNAKPSFIGEPINSSFYYNNRLGFLSGANVIMSQARDVYNFFGRSQLALVDSDPIDVNANSTRPVELYEVVTQQQGVLLFGTRQQFWLSAPDTGVLTPTRSVIRTISSYESDKNISPLDIGTTIGFVSKTPDYSKLMVMQGQGDDVDPVVVEISKVVTGWLPNTIGNMAVSPQNSFVALTGNDENFVYIYRFYNDGQEDRMQAWAKWEMPGKVQGITIMNDMVYTITLQADRYVTTWLSLNSLDKSGPQLSDDPFKPGAPYLDFMSVPESVSYDATTNETYFYTKFPLLTDRSPRMILTLPFQSGMPMAASRLELIEGLRQMPRTTDDDPGYWSECEQGTNDTGSYFKLRGDFSGYENGIVLGYSFNYEVILPKFYFKIAAKNNAADYSAHLNINRVKFAVGLTGGIAFKLKAMGSDEWVDIQHVTDADYYEADTDPIAEERLFTVPINQRNKYFQLKVTSDLPFPVSLVSMMWEGQYSPRFYRRS